MDDVTAPPDFESYVAARRPSLRRTAYLLTGDWDRAEDVVQDVGLAWLGIDHESFHVKFQGLDAKLTGVEGAKVIKGILV